MDVNSSESGSVQSFGGWVQRRRRAPNLTRAELADEVGCAAVTIKKIERDERKPSPQIAALLAEKLMIARAERDQFMRMAREPFAASAGPKGESLLIPSLLRNEERNPYLSKASFVGRHKELSRLEASLQKALAGNAMPIF